MQRKSLAIDCGAADRAIRRFFVGKLVQQLGEYQHGGQAERDGDDRDPANHLGCVPAAGLLFRMAARAAISSSQSPPMPW